MTEGKFIVFEGIDGCGKTSQAKLLTAFLKKKGIPAIFTYEHQRKKVGELIEKVLYRQLKLDPLALQLCFIADRCDHINSFIKPQLKSGKTVICDRYYWSTVAYGADQDQEWLLAINKYIRIKPDLCFWLEVDPRVSLERINRGREAKTLFEQSNFLETVNRHYRWLVQHDDVPVIRIDGNQKLMTIHQEILAKLGYGSSL